MKSSESIIQLAAALAKAQAAFAVPNKSKVATVKSKDGYTVLYTYTYADLADVIEAVRPGLSANGLSILSMLNHESTRAMLETILMHESGEWVSMLYPVDLTGRPQDVGGQLTYARRYSISCMLGVASEDDDDANAAQGNNATTGKKSAGNAGNRNTTTTGSSSASATDKPAQPTDEGREDGSSSGADAKAAKDRAVTLYTRWAKKLIEAQASHPEKLEMLNTVKAENNIKSDPKTINPKLSANEILEAAKRLMINVCNTTGETEDSTIDAAMTA